MHQLFSRKQVIVLISSLSLLVLGFGLYVPIKLFWHATTTPSQQPNAPIMTVFVHGSFASLLGFLSFSDVMQDKMSGTAYREVTKRMRMDDYFFKAQPILQRGLIPVTPTLNLADTKNNKYAAYPLAKVYQTISNTLETTPEKQLFYTFGWSGLISQASRRYEAIRLYNALQEELDKLKAQGIAPKIRLIAHSHGGNLCLNLAAVTKVLEAHAFDQKHIYATDPDEQESVEQMAQMILRLTTFELAKMRPDQKAYDYVPLKHDLVIDELIMYGVPIQQETESFCFAPTFKRVYHFYSAEDYVQRADWVSSKKSLSVARITKRPSLTNLKAGNAAKLVQAQIVIGQGAGKAQEITPNKPTPTERKGLADQLVNIWNKLCAGENIFQRHSNDPTHKELWFFMWQPSEAKFTPAFAPLPVVAFTPIIITALNQAPNMPDAVVSFHQEQDRWCINAAPWGKQAPTVTRCVSKALITQLQEQVRAWEPDKQSGFDEFEVISKHLGR